MRKIAMSGLVALTAVLGSAAPASAAPAAPGPVSRVLPERALAGMSTSFSASGRISCGSPRTCLAIGGLIRSGELAATAEAWNGAKWKSVAVKAPKGGYMPILTGVSCKSARSCLVTGSYTAKSSGKALAYSMTWNGTALRPAAKIPIPKRGSLIDLNALYCVTTARCVAFGTMTRSSVKSVILVATWNGKRWAARTAGNPGGARLVVPTAASCRSLASCVTTGVSFAASRYKIEFASWNGKSFIPMKAKAPAGLPDSITGGLSCVSAKRCVAVGMAGNASGRRLRGFAEVWRGKGAAWTPATITWPKADSVSGLADVSCLSVSNCVAVGADGTPGSQRASALFFNGKKWAFQRVPGPAKGESSRLDDVNCPKARDCVAIGQTGPSSGAPASMLGGIWKGAAWRLLPA